MYPVDVHLVYPHPHHTKLWDETRKHFGMLLTALIGVLTTFFLVQPWEALRSFCDSILLNSLPPLPEGGVDDDSSSNHDCTLNIFRVFFS